jgi:hypothetical protein
MSVETQAAAGADAQAVSKPSTGYSYFVVWFLAVVYTLNFLDRQIVSILGKDISRELGLSKTEFGLLGGTSFALLYTTCGIGVAYLADRVSRKWIIALACAIWSLFTALCGTAQNFVQILLYRMGVGFGEAGGSPPSYSLISDYFPAEKRGTALAIYSLGVPIGSMLGAFAGGDHPGAPHARAGARAQAWRARYAAERRDRAPAGAADPGRHRRLLPQPHARADGGLQRHVGVRGLRRPRLESAVPGER